MSTPGIGDPYWYEWFVGLKYVLRMLNPDSGISCVVFQHGEYNTIDDVVVEYDNGNKQLCYQVKHEISTSVSNSLTFGKMLETKDGKKSLFEALFLGWKDANSPGSHTIKPVLFTNRTIHNRRATRTDNGEKYSAYPVDKFVSLIQNEISGGQDLSTINERDSNLAHQWNELCNALRMANKDELISFFEVLSIEGNQQNLTELEQSLVESLSQTFECNIGVARELFGRLLVGLKTWTTTERHIQQVFLEDVYSVLGFEEDIDDSQHRLAAPYPFFESRQVFCEELDKKLLSTEKKVVFLSGDPGSGKTSTISYLQATTSRFLLRYHTFKPISPEQRFYNTDPGMCTPENLWGTLLIQLRKKFHGRLSQYNVPLSNKLVSVEAMRNHVLRLLGVLADEATSDGVKIFVCIDGIDHAARANTPLSFLSSLPLPSEIPDGVCFVIVGQPSAVYREQYPTWLSTSEDVDRVSMPKLCVGDIEQLILSQAKRFARNASGLASLIFEKTEGNNLSAVFAVEEVKALQTLDDAVEQIRSSGITADIQQYYEHIWAHMKIELSRIVKAATFPESIVACPLLLMNGRVNVRILARALAAYGMIESDWVMIFERLYPLVIQTDDSGEYALFHNDFRVFLMGVISEYQPRYEEIALALAQDLLQNEEGLLTYVTAIPLLECANRACLIPQYFTPGFVINALAEGISKGRLDEFAHIAYRSACDCRDINGLRNTYLAVKTLYQHNRYFEYYGKEYNCSDYPEISFVDISEIRTLPVEKQNLDEYENVLSLCRKLHSSRMSDHRLRGVTLYQKWFEHLTPQTFVLLCEDKVPEDSDWELRTTDTGFFLQHWGNIAAELDMPVPRISKPTFQLELRAVITFGEQYFDFCISHKKYVLAVSALISGYIAEGVFAEKLEEIYYGGASGQFEDFLLRVSVDEGKPTSALLARAMKVTCDPNYIPEGHILDSVRPIKHVYDEACFVSVLQAFLLGCANREKDEAALLDLLSKVCSELKGKGSEKEQLAFLVRTASLIGKYYWDGAPASDKLMGYAIWLLSAKLHRRFDYSKARRFLLYTLLHSQAGISYCAEEWFIDALRISLFEIDSLGMYYKTAILDYFKQHDRLDIIGEYIETLYGENCCNINMVEDKAEMHMRFSMYGELVHPELIQKFSSQLKWDVVGYMGYKEYAMHAPLDSFRIISEAVPARWKDLGADLYCQSEIADYSSNHASYEIKNELSKAAVACGLSDFWELRAWSDDFRLSPDQIYHSLFEFINNATTASDLEALWILSCGIHSWYTQDGRNGAQNIFNACVAQAQKIGVDFSSFAMELTPQWISIISHQSEQQKFSPDEKSYAAQRIQEFEDIKTQYADISIDETILALPAVRTSANATAHYKVILEKVSSDDRNIKENLTSVLMSVCEYLQSKEWTYERYDSLINSLLTALGDDAFWEIAKCIEAQLSDYDYQTSSRNLQLLFKLTFTDDIAGMESLFNAELQTQALWISGNGHIDIAFDSKRSPSEFPLPQSLPEMALYILLEQIETKNARKIETAIFAIYLLGLRFTEIMSALPSIWDNLSDLQTECLLLIIAKWIADGKCSEEIYIMLLRAYDSCGKLSHKYLQHSILLRLNVPEIEPDVLTYCADSEKYAFPEDGVDVQAHYCEAFLALLEECDEAQQSVDAIRRYISLNDELEECPKDTYAETGDFGVPVIKGGLDSFLYAEEKIGGWDSLPLLRRKSRLIPSEDPFLLTEMPQITFDETWFPCILNEYGQEESQGLSDEQMAAIVQGNVGEDEIVLAACLWFPWRHKAGKRYCEVAKIGFDKGTYQTSRGNWSMGNYGILAYEGTIEEANVEDPCFGGVNLFNHLGGIHRLFHGNCQLVPSSIWREFFGCKPSDMSPYVWVNEDGDRILYFERIASPYREAIQESYVRQPILFRWVCNASWLEKVLRDNKLELWKVVSSEDYPAQ